MFPFGKIATAVQEMGFANHDLASCDSGKTFKPISGQIKYNYTHHCICGPSQKNRWVKSGRKVSVCAVDGWQRQTILMSHVSCDKHTCDRSGFLFLYSATKWKHRMSPSLLHFVPIIIAFIVLLWRLSRTQPIQTFLHALVMILMNTVLLWLK